MDLVQSGAMEKIVRIVLQDNSHSFSREHDARQVSQDLSFLF